MRRLLDLLESQVLLPGVPKQDADQSWFSGGERQICLLRKNWASLALSILVEMWSPAWEDASSISEERSQWTRNDLTDSHPWDQRLLKKEPTPNLNMYRNGLLGAGLSYAVYFLVVMGALQNHVLYLSTLSHTLWLWIVVLLPAPGLVCGLLRPSENPSLWDLNYPSGVWKGSLGSCLPSVRMVPIAQGRHLVKSHLVCWNEFKVFWYFVIFPL